MDNRNSQNLIFLISQPRAGSTMLQLMLSGHPDIATTSEPWIALHPFFALKDQGLDAIYNAEVARAATKEFLEQSGLDEAFYKEQVAHFLNSFYQKAIRYQNKKCFLDKTPRYYLIIDDLMELFPDAKFIFLIRHPLAVLNSIMKTWVKDDYKKLGLLKDDLLLAPKLLAGAIKRYSDKSYTVKYEEFVRNPETVLAGICSYLGVDYYEDMLDYGKRLPDWKFGDPVGIQKSSRPSEDSLVLWKKGFESPQLRLIAHSYLEEIGRDLIEEMGYDFEEAVSASLLPGASERKDLMMWPEIMAYDYKKDRLADQIDAMANTLSWKLTKPLRQIGDIFKRYFW